MDRTRLDWAHLIKNELSAVIKRPGVMTPFCRSSVLNAVVSSAVHSYTDMFQSVE